MAAQAGEFARPLAQPKLKQFAITPQFPVEARFQFAQPIEVAE